MSWKDATKKLDPNHSVEITRPYLQFHRGDLQNSNKLLKAGCFQWPVEQFGHIIGDVWPAINVIHAGGVEIESYLTDKLHIAPIAFSKEWLHLDAAGQWSPGYVDGSKNKSRFRIFGLSKELVDDANYLEPVVFTVSGMNAKHTEASFKQFKTDVIVSASRLSKHRFPTYAFYLALKAGPKQTTAHNQYITPPTLAIGEINEKALDKLYVGDEVLVAAQGFWEEAQQWTGTVKPEPQPQPNGDSELDTHFPRDANGNPLEPVMINDNREAMEV